MFHWFVTGTVDGDYNYCLNPHQMAEESLFCWKCPATSPALLAAFAGYTPFYPSEAPSNPHEIIIKSQ